VAISGIASTVWRGQGEPTDRFLVQRCQQGDTAAWRVLYERYAPTVHRFISALGVPPSEREDACQDVFVAIYRSLPRFRGDAQLSTWIYKIAARGTSRLNSRRKLQPPSDLSERTARLRLLDGLLQKLDAKKRLVLVLFELEGLPIEEVARIAGCPTNTAWSRLHHARAQLLKVGKRRAG
jgi:RNA polymerase sigma-70 factor (ECF subfamily)